MCQISHEMRNLESKERIEVLTLKRHLSLWRLVVFGLLLQTCLCASALTGTPTTHAQNIANRLLGNNPVFSHAGYLARGATLKSLSSKTPHVESKSELLSASFATNRTCTASTVTGTTTTRGAIAFIEYTIPTLSAHPYMITKGLDGAYWFVENGGNKIGRIFTSAGSTTLTECPVPTTNADLEGITAGPTGTGIWFTEAGANQIGNITLSGTTATFNEYPVPTAGAYPVNIVTGPDGNVWFTEQNASQLGMITTGATPTVTEFTGLTANSGPLAIITVGASLWFTEPWADQIGQYTPGATTPLTEYTGLAANAFPFGITAGPTVSGATTLWFTEPDINSIGHFAIPTTGTTVTVTDTPIPTASSDPNFLASFSGTGTLAFNEAAGNNSSTINTGTNAITEYALPTASSHPLGIVNGSTNSVWLAEAAANKIALMQFRSGNF
jgi:virginiamycin B lyase